MRDRELQDEEEGGSPFRELFSGDETREFFRPVFQLPTRQIAFWSIGLSVLLAVALVFSARHEPGRSVTKSVSGFRRKAKPPILRAKTDTAMYLRQQNR